MALDRTGCEALFPQKRKITHLQALRLRQLAVDANGGEVALYQQLVELLGARN